MHWFIWWQKCLRIRWKKIITDDVADDAYDTSNEHISRWADEKTDSDSIKAAEIDGDADDTANDG